MTKTQNFSNNNTILSKTKENENSRKNSHQLINIENSTFNYLNDKKYNSKPKNSIITFQMAKANEVVPNVQNVVSTVSLGVQLDLKRIALKARNAEYNPRRFAAVIMRIRDPKTTALIFSSGKMVITGAKSEESSKIACKKYARIIQRLGYGHAKFLDFKIQNIVASCDIRFPIRLESLAHAHSQFCSYEPELFPGLIYRMITPKVVLLIFVSGKLVLTGAKERKDIYQAFSNIYAVLCLFKKG
mmetsp:Transcript_16615/g.40057  ORF Transcript_16615/g.40057 Transcript_16615/m.40057 type:complete len:244 (-) Transcript_16615:335-1066(-)